MSRRSLFLVLGVVLLALVATLLLRVPQVRILFAEERPSAVAGEEAPRSTAGTRCGSRWLWGHKMGDEAQRATVRRTFETAGGPGHDALLLLGDLIYDDGDADLTDELVTDAFAPVTDAGAELILKQGNHDYESGEEDEIFEEPGRPDRWYVDRVGPVRVVVLDSNEVDDEQQTDWLRGTLAEPQPTGCGRSWPCTTPRYSAGSTARSWRSARRGARCSRSTTCRWCWRATTTTTSAPGPRMA